MGTRRAKKNAQQDEPEASRKKIGSEIQRRRLEIHMKQAELADAAGISESYMSKIESGGADVGLEVLLRIAEALHVPVASFFGSIAPLSVLGGELAQLFDKAAPEIQEAVLKILRSPSVQKPTPKT